MKSQQVRDMVRRWIGLLVVVTLLAAALGFFVSLQLPRVYEGSAMLLVTPSQADTAVSSYNDVLTGQQLTRTYAEVLKTQPVVDQAAQNVGLMGDYTNTVRLLDVKPIINTQLIQIKARASTPELASSFANELARVFTQQTQASQSSRFGESEKALSEQVSSLRQLVDERTRRRDELQAQDPSPSRDNELIRVESALLQLQQSYSTAVHNYADSRLAAGRARDLLSLVQPAPVPSAPVEPRTLLNVALAAVIGLILALLTAVVAEYIDDRLSTPDRVTHFTQLQSLAAIAVVPKGVPLLVSQLTPDASANGHQSQGGGGEAFRLLHANLRFAAVERPLQTVIVTSADTGDGKTTVSANLAIVAAQAGLRVLLVDADLRRPAQQRTFNLPNRRGLTSLLISPELSLADVLAPSGVEGLSIVASGPLPPNPSQLLASERMRTRLAEFKREFELVLLDSPPTLAVSDPVVLAPNADGVLLVVNAQSTRGHAAAQAAALLRSVGGNLLGVVMNRAKPERGSYYGYYTYKPSPANVGGESSVGQPVEKVYG